jgi:hypothetical protein
MGQSTAMEALTAELLGDVGKLHDEVKDLKSALPGAVETIRLAGVEASKVLAFEVEKAVASLGKAASDAEVARIQGQVNEIARAVLLQIRRESSASAPHGWKVKVAFGIAGLVLLGAVAGAVIGAWSVSKQGPADQVSSEQAKQLEAGRDFLQVLPQLDDATRQKVIRMIQKNRG